MSSYHLLALMMNQIIMKHMYVLLVSGLVIAMLVSLIFILLLRCLAGVMVWIMIVLVIIVIGYGTRFHKSFFFKTFIFLFSTIILMVNSFFVIYLLNNSFNFKKNSCFRAGIFHCYMQYASLKGQAGSDVTIKDLGLQTDFSVYLQIQQTWLAFSECLLIKVYLTVLLQYVFNAIVHNMHFLFHF